MRTPVGKSGTRRWPQESEERALERLWGIDACPACGATVVLGEGLVAPHGDAPHARLCVACAAASTATARVRIGVSGVRGVAKLVSGTGRRLRHAA